MENTNGPVRILNLIDRVTNVPVCVVWEITLGCNLRCSHCGSRAGLKRTNELSFEECKKIVDELHELGTREICLIGGEVFIRPDWVYLVRYIKQKGIYCVVQTGGYKFPIDQLESALKFGLDGIGISIDGFKDDHDVLRGRSGSFNSAIELLRWCKQNSCSVSVNTQICSKNKNYIIEFGHFLMNEGVEFWQLQLTVPMGNASDQFEICLQPYELEKLYKSIYESYDELKKGGLLVMPGNNMGYFGPYEYLWRGPDRGGHYDGCTAGVNGMGIEADGTLKACPSLPKERYSCGSSRNTSIKQAWHSKKSFMWNRQPNERTYSGYCAECYYKDSCKAGCTWMSDSLFGEPGNNPYCIHRVIELKKKGIKEVVEKTKEATNIPFGTGKYKISEIQVIEITDE